MDLNAGVDVNCGRKDGRTDGRKTGRLYCILLKQGHTVSKSLPTTWLGCHVAFPLHHLDEVLAVRVPMELTFNFGFHR